MGDCQLLLKCTAYGKIHRWELSALIVTMSKSALLFADVEFIINGKPLGLIELAKEIHAYL
jgi:hypothetical protein